MFMPFQIILALAALLAAFYLPYLLLLFTKYCVRVFVETREWRKAKRLRSEPEPDWQTFLID